MGGGGKSKGPTGPTPAEEKLQAQNYWSNYSQWSGDAKTKYDTDLSTQRAKFAAGGSAGGSEAYAEYEKGRTAEYDKEMAGLDRGEHANYLNDYMKRMGGSGDMNKYYGGMFGEYEGSTGSKEKAAKDRAGEAAAGRQSAASQQMGAEDESKLGKKGWW